MREIKFRTWDETGKEMIGPNDFYQNADGSAGCHLSDFFEIHEDGTVGVEHENVIFMQFTGLKDKNGKECFEGDIVKRLDYDGKGKLKEYINEIRYIDEEGAFCFYLEYLGGKGWSRMHAGHAVYWWKIIGNIYENPELLKAN